MAVMRNLRAVWRLLHAVLHLLRGLAIVYLRFPRIDQAARWQHIHTWSRQLLGIMGIELHLWGEPPQHGPLLLVSNHISWLDIVLLHAVCPCRFVAKSDIKDWPIIGRLAQGADSLFIARERPRDAMRVVHAMAAALQAGELVAIFPEGTTSPGDGVLPFHANLLQAAVSAQAPVQPLALRFSNAQGQQSYAPQYVGDESLVESVWRTVRAQGLQAHVRLGSAVASADSDRRKLAQALQNQVSALLNAESGKHS